MTEELSGIFEDSLTDAEVEKKVDEEGWNMDAVENFRRREEELATAEEGGLPISPTTEESSFSDINGTNPIDESTAVVPEQQQAQPQQAPQKSFGESFIAGEYGINPIPALSQIRDIPIAGAPSTYAMIRALKPDSMSMDEWYDSVQKKMATYNAENPILAPLTSLPVSAVPALMTGQVAPMLQRAATASPVIAGAIAGSATAAQQPQYEAQERAIGPTLERAAAGAALGGAIAGGMKAITPVLSPGAQQFQLEPGAYTQFVNEKLNSFFQKKPKILGSNAIFKYFTGSVKKKMGGEAARAVEDMVADPNRFRSIKDVAEARTEIIHETQQILNEITARGTENEAAITKASKNFTDAVDKLSARAEELRTPANEMADQIADMHDNLIDDNISRYDRGWTKLPSTETYIANPQTGGFPLSKVINALESAKFKSKGVIGPRKPAIDGVNNELESDISQLKQYALELAGDVVGDSGAYQFLKNNIDLLDDRTALNARLSAIRGHNTNAAAVNRLLSYYDNVPADFVRKKLGEIFSGFKIERKSPVTTGEAIRKSVEGQTAYTNAHTNLRNAVAEHYNNPEFNRITKTANLINTKYILPLRNKIRINGLNTSRTVNDFKSAMNSNTDQFRKAFQYAVDSGMADRDLLTYARAVQLDQRAKGALNVRPGNFDELVEGIASRQHNAVKFLDSLSRSDEQFRILFQEVKQAAEDVLTARDEFDTVVKEVRGLFPEVYKQVGGKGVDLAKTLVSEMTPSGKVGYDVGAVESDAARGLESIYRYNFGGDSEAASAAIDQIKKIRQIEAINADVGKKPASKGETAATSISTATFGRAGYAAARTLAWLASKFSKEYTNGKWTNANVYIIEKALQRAVDKKMYQKNYPQIRILNGYDDVEPRIISLVPYEVKAVIDAIRSDKNLTTKEKVDAIKKINQDGIKLENQ